MTTNTQVNVKTENVWASAHTTEPNRLNIDVYVGDLRAPKEAYMIGIVSEKGIPSERVSDIGLQGIIAEAVFLQARGGFIVPRAFIDSGCRQYWPTNAQKVAIPESILKAAGVDDMRYGTYSEMGMLTQEDLQYIKNNCSR